MYQGCLLFLKYRRAGQNFPIAILSSFGEGFSIDVRFVLCLVPEFSTSVCVFWLSPGKKKRSLEAREPGPKQYDEVFPCSISESLHVDGIPRGGQDAIREDERRTTLPTHQRKDKNGEDRLVLCNSNGFDCLHLIEVTPLTPESGDGKVRVLKKMQIFGTSMLFWVFPSKKTSPNSLVWQVFFCAWQPWNQHSNPGSHHHVALNGSLKNWRRILL